MPNTRLDVRGCSFFGEVHREEKMLVATTAHQFDNWRGVEMTQQRL